LHHAPVNAANCITGAQAGQLCFFVFFVFRIRRQPKSGGLIVSEFVRLGECGPFFDR